MARSFSLAALCVAYREERFIPKYIQALTDRVDKIVVLNSTKPWFGEELEKDKTAAIARFLNADVIEYYWENEHEQRNAGLDYLSEYDWVLVLDPDEYFDDANWNKLINFLEKCEAPAAIVEGQYTYWKDGWVADPPRDYLQLIAVRPKEVRFIDKRVINSGFAKAPVWLHHFSWARTDEEVWRKISHYAHAKDFDIQKWYNEVWLKWKPGDMDVHPTTPETLHRLIKAELPPEIERLKLWPD